MVSDLNSQFLRWRLFLVLILVLMEYGLWPRSSALSACSGCVLILVLMEYGLWLSEFTLSSESHTVLILVLMEYGLWRRGSLGARGLPLGLNPCSNGIWSLTERNRSALERHVRVLILVLMEYGLWHMCRLDVATHLTCLNPCSNGIWSLTCVRTQARSNPHTS